MHTSSHSDNSPLLIAPDGCTTFRASAIPTAHQLADRCHPRSDPARWLRESATAWAAPATDEPPRRLLGIWAHPDDEAYLSAGLMALTVAAGGHVTVVAITNGEAGFADDDPRSPEQRSAQRQRELRSAMARIGVTDVRFLGIADGEVASVPTDEVVAEIAGIIGDVGPDVVVSFGPDGVTGHADHVANSHLVTRAWGENPIGDLWYAAKTDQWLAEWRQLHDDFGVWMTGEPIGVRPEDVELIIELEGDALDTKRDVLAEHKSQTEGLAAAFGEDRYRRWICQEVFRRPSRSELSLQRARVGAAP